ncbi:MAG: fatty acid desaturase [Pseudobdellovibrionaceae bacterium]
MQNQNRIQWQRIDWTTTLFLTITPVVCFVLVPLYLWYWDLSWAMISFSLIFAALTNLSITAGYHRLFSHRAYEAHPWVRAFWLLVGASAFQGSALKWSADHRKHHNKVDSEDDPYSINKGFWYAHMGWLFLKDSTDPHPTAADLEKDWMVVLQHRYYVAFAILMGFAVPAFVGWLMGAPFAGFLFAGALRIVLTQQSTFCVNSLTHTFGKRPYSEEVSARDSFWVAVITHGEGYHNYHHRFQTDYRNGIRWYHWDPTKWTIQLLALFGLAQRLRTISKQEILKARLQIEERRLLLKGVSQDKLLPIKERILTAGEALRQLRRDYESLKVSMNESSQARLEQLKLQMEEKRLEFEFALKQWRIYLDAKSGAFTS